MKSITLKKTSLNSVRSKVHQGFTWTELLVCLAILGVLMAVVLPTMLRSPREAAMRMQCSNNLKQIGLALLDYEQKYQMLPPAYTMDPEGNRLHSWRTLILPFLGQTQLYEKIDLIKAWDDPANERICREKLSAYQCPSTKGKDGFTTYFAIVGERSIFRPQQGRAISEIIDGTSNTVMVYESDPSQAVHWMSPNDATEDLFVSSNAQSKTAHTGGRQFCMADGSVRFLSKEAAKDFLTSLATVDGNEKPFDAE